jgi:glycosyltransferase involved in cell wall biosynthesis
MPYRGAKRLLWRAYTAFEEWNLQWMADRALTFANGTALAAKHTRPGREVVETTTTTIAASDVATRDDTPCGATLRLLTVSRIDPRKGLRVLPGVVRRLLDQGREASIDVVGPTVGAPGETERRAIEDESARLELGDRVRLRGPVPLERLLALYREYDVFVLPTLPGEGIPRVLLEAMTAGLPVVTTRVAGIPSLIVDGVNGLLVDESSAEAVCAAIARLAADGPLRRRLIAGGYDTARAHTLETQAASMMQIVSQRLGVALLPVAAPASS